MLFTTRCSSRLLGVRGVCGTSESSLEVTDEVGLYANVGREIIVIWRRRDTATVASAAISRASVGEWGFVLKTTKKGMDAERAKVEGSGRVTWFTAALVGYTGVSDVYTETYSTFEWYGPIRMQWNL